MSSDQVFPDIYFNISNSDIIFTHRMRPFNAVVILLIFEELIYLYNSKIKVIQKVYIEKFCSHLSLHLLPPP